MNKLGRLPTGKIHELKTWPPYWEHVYHNEKNFEVRKADRDFQVGDILRLLEWNPETEKYTGRHIQVQITYILKDAPFGIEEGYCVLGLRQS